MGETFDASQFCFCLLDNVQAKAARHFRLFFFIYGLRLPFNANLRIQRNEPYLDDIPELSLTSRC